MLMLATPEPNFGFQIYVIRFPSVDTHDQETNTTNGTQTK